MIDVADDFLSQEELSFVVKYCVDAPYYYGEADNSDTPVTGMVHNIWFDGMNEDELLGERKPGGGVDDSTIDTKKFYQLFANKIAEKFPECDKKYIVRLYINCFAPSENPYFHTDEDPGIDAKTFLFYATPGYDIDDGGETQFVIDGSLYGIPPFQNRLVSFPATILHRATTYRDRYRFTVAIKYNFTERE
jgi:hypothetical protein